MYSINALEVPEIVQIIAGYLSDFIPCLTVCKAWRSLYLPYYWREAEAGIVIREAASKDQPPVFDPIRHGHYRKLIRGLTVYTDYDPINQSLDYPNLRTLRLCFKQRIGWRRVDENPVLKEFVNRHPWLKCLDLSNIPHSVMDSTWTALVGHPSLEKVVMRSKTSFSDDFWKVCTQLRTLEFKGHHHYGILHIPKDLRMPFIRRLDLEGGNISDTVGLLQLIVACPLLEDFAWERRGTYSEQKWERFAQLATQGIWPHLRQLTIRVDITDASLSQAIASMHHATKIDIHGGLIGPLSFAALQRHASTLQHLVIPTVMSSWMVQDVLCTFARLEHLRAGRIDAKDIAKGGPWVCTSLREMSVEISFNRMEGHLQSVVFERMSRLAHLEKFDNRFRKSYQGTLRHGLIFRLQSGMGALASLTRLRCMWWDPNVQGIDLDDARWIMDHWKRLETIRGRLNKDITVQEQLEDLFSTNGIELQKERRMVLVRKYAIMRT